MNRYETEVEKLAGINVGNVIEKKFKEIEVTKLNAWYIDHTTRKFMFALEEVRENLVGRLCGYSIDPGIPAEEVKGLARELATVRKVIETVNNVAKGK